MTVISYPIPPYSNPPIEPQFYQPSRFVISEITFGQTTIVTTTEDMNYVIGQLVRLIIPPLCGSRQLNEQTAFVIDIPAANQVTLDINSTNADEFFANPYVVTITGATNSNPTVITALNVFTKRMGVLIEGVGGMTELNNLSWMVLGGKSTTFTINADSTGFGVYTSGGTATLIGFPQILPQILPVGDTNTGIISSTGRIIPTTHIPGSFINIS